MNYFIEARPGTRAPALLFGIISMAYCDLKTGHLKKSSIHVLSFDGAFSDLSNIIPESIYLDSDLRALNIAADLIFYDLGKLKYNLPKLEEYFKDFINSFDLNEGLLFIEDACQFPEFFIEWLVDEATKHSSVLGISSMSKNDFNGRFFCKGWTDMVSPMHYRLKN